MDHSKSKVSNKTIELRRNHRAVMRWA